MPTLTNTPNLTASVAYAERTDDYAPSTSGFDFNGGRASAAYLVSDSDLDASIIDLLGYTNPNAGYSLSTGGGSSGALPGLNRKCPKAHSRWPWLYASRIASIQGLTKGTKTIGNAIGEANPMPFYSAYPEYRVEVDFEPRPYYVLPDSQIPTGTVTWTQEDGTAVTNNYAAEWLRYVDYQILPKPELVMSQHGSMAFFTRDGSRPGRVGVGSGTPLAGITFPGFLRMFVCQAEIRMTWYQVPYSYLESSNSRLVSYAGYINQTDWFRWKAGELLYLGAVAKKYTPPSPERTPDPESSTVGVVMPAKLCDIEMSFLYTKRVGTNVPTPGNANWVPAGHNLQPWLFDRRFYYVAGGGQGSTVNDQPPTFLSREFALLFSNPDS